MSAKPMKRTLVVVLLALGAVGCGGSDASPEANAPSDSAAEGKPAVSQFDGRTMQMWSRSCALCHVDGNGGAPRTGNRDEWASRLVQGDAVLLDHALAGFNGMPPLGYCMACERDDFVAMISFMTAGVEATPSEPTP